MTDQSKSSVQMTAEFLANADLEQVMRWQSVKGELGLHLPELRGPRREYLAVCILKRIERDERDRNG